VKLASISLRSGRSWWWVFAILIAAPALALAFLGLRVLKLERMERAQQVREQQAQLAHLADRALANLLGALESELARVESSPAGLPDHTIFILETGGRLVFARDKTYLPDAAKADFRPGAKWTPKIEQMIERAQAAEAQQRSSEAASLFVQIGRAEPRLKKWSELELTRLQFDNGNQAALAVLANPSWASSDGVTSHASTLGDYPRIITIDPSGQFMVSGNQRADNVTTFRANPGNGKLTFTGDYTAVGSPSGMVFLI
jgi:hypothetical protein